jgi:putative protease
LYVSVERIEDLYLAQAARPAGAILSLNSRTAARLLGDHAPIPFGRERIILRLDPFFPEGQAEDVADWVDKLASHNWRNFMACNLGHFSLLRQANTRRPLNILAGPELYAFNRHAGAFLFAAGANALVAPLESARQSLERAFDNKRERAAVFVTLFAWPRLFSVQSDVHHLYDFTRFTDARDEEFLLCSGNERSFVLPARPFSIVDKLPFLYQAGFTRFIVDFGPLPVQKKVFREVVKSLETGAPVSDATRFNWKDGFYTPQETTPAARGGAQTAPLRTNRKE